MTNFHFSRLASQLHHDILQIEMPGKLLSPARISRQGQGYQWESPGEGKGLDLSSVLDLPLFLFGKEASYLLALLHWYPESFLLALLGSINPEIRGIQERKTSYTVLSHALTRMDSGQVHSSESQQEAMSCLL